MAVTADYQFDLAGVTMGQGATIGAGGTLAFTEISGLDMPEVDTTTSLRSNDDGAFVYSRYLKERVIVMQGRLNTSADSYAYDTYALKTIFKPTATPVAFTFKLPGLDVQQIDVQPQGVRYAVRNVETAVGMVDFIATLTAGDPRIYSASTATMGPLTAGAGGAGATFPMTFPVTFSAAGTSPANTATNAGNFVAPTTITLDGPLTNPRIVNATTGESMQLLITIDTGTSVVIDSLDRTVIFQGASRYSTLTSGSSFINLAPGDNALTLYADSGAGNAYVSWQNTWI